MSDSKSASPSPSGLVEELRRLDKAATPGPWLSVKNWQEPYKHVEFDDGNDYTTSPLNAEDADLIAHLRTNLPQIISCLETAERDRKADNATIELLRRVCLRLAEALTLAEKEHRSDCAIHDALTAAREENRLADELCAAIDLMDEDIGGHRPVNDILAEFGPAVDELTKALSALSED